MQGAWRDSTNEQCPDSCQVVAGTRRNWPMTRSTAIGFNFFAGGSLPLCGIADASARSGLSRQTCLQTSAGTGIGNGSRGRSRIPAELPGRIVTLVVSERNLDPPPCRRYSFTRSRKLSAFRFRKASSCWGEQKRPPLSRTSRGRGWPHHWHRPLPSSGLSPEPEGPPACSPASSPICANRYRSAWSRQQNPSCRRRVSSGNASWQ